MTDHPENDHPLHAGINTKLAEIAASAPTPPSWYDAWSRLGPQSTERERPAVYRAVRDAGTVPEEAGFFLFACRSADDDHAGRVGGNCCASVSDVGTCLLLAEKITLTAWRLYLGAVCRP
jgi:hypothetical protein